MCNIKEIRLWGVVEHDFVHISYFSVFPAMPPIMRNPTFLPRIFTFSFLGAGNVQYKRYPFLGGCGARFCAHFVFFRFSRNAPNNEKSHFFSSDFHVWLPGGLWVAPDTFPMPQLLHNSGPGSMKMALVLILDEISQ